MFERLLLSALVLAASGSAFAGDLGLALRHRSAQASANLIDAVGLYEAPLAPWLTAEVGARLSVSSRDFEAADYKGELRAQPFSFWEVALRIYHSNRLADGTGVSQWMATTTLAAWNLGFFGVGATFGWQQRYVKLDGNFGLPFVAGASFTDRDFAARLAFLLRPAERWLARFGLSNIEEFDVFNLNNPFLFLTVEHTPADSRFTILAFARYRALLGFGRRDEFLVGAGLRFSLGG